VIPGNTREKDKTPKEKKKKGKTKRKENQDAFCSPPSQMEEFKYASPNRTSYPRSNKFLSQKLPKQKTR
jgi:hypothetical protein